MIRKYGKKIGFHLLAAFIGLMALLPFLWMLSTSLKSRGALMVLPIEWIPKEPSFNAYRKVFSMFPFAKAIGNSLLIAVCYTLITVLSSSMAAFAFTKIKFPLANRVFKMYLACMMIPTQITLIPLFVVMNKMGMTQTYGSVIFPSLFRSFAVFLLVQSMRTVPNDFMEAAQMDGATLFCVYRRVMLPLCAPTIATLCVTTFMDSWNDYLWPLVMLTNKSKMTLPLALNQLNGQYGTEYNVLMAGSLISMIPIILVYIGAQKYFKQGLMSGGVKG